MVSVVVGVVGVGVVCVGVVGDVGIGVVVATKRPAELGPASTALLAPTAPPPLPVSGGCC